MTFHGYGGTRVEPDHSAESVPGRHKVHIVLVNGNHHPLDNGTITFVVPDIAESGDPR